MHIDRPGLIPSMKDSVVLSYFYWSEQTLIVLGAGWPDLVFVVNTLCSCCWASSKAVDCIPSVGSLSCWVYSLTHLISVLSTRFLLLGTINLCPYPLITALRLPRRISNVGLRAIVALGGRLGGIERLPFCWPCGDRRSRQAFSARTKWLRARLVQI